MSEDISQMRYACWAGQRELPLFVRCFGRTEDEACTLGSWKGTQERERQSTKEEAPWDTFSSYERLREVAGKLSRPFAEISKAGAWRRNTLVDILLVW